MRSGFWTNLKRCLLGGMTGVMLCASPARADEKSDIAELKAIVEAQQKQIQDLKKTIEVDYTPNAAGAVAPLTQGAVEQAVDAALQKKEEAAKAEAKKAEDAGHKVGSDLKMTTRWNQFNGFTAETANKDFRIHFGGRFNFDSVWWTQDPFLRPANQAGTYTDGTFFRRLRIAADGQFWEVFEFNTEYQFEQTTENIPNLDEFWVGVQKLPFVGTVRIGHLKVQQGLESLSSSKVLTFMERSPVFDAFWAEFAPGIWVTNTYADEHGTWGVQALRNERNNDGADFGDGEYLYSGRLTALPMYENEGRCVMHLGASATYRVAERPDPSTGGNPTARFRARPPMRDAQGAFGTAPLPGNSTRLIDTGNIRCDDVINYAAEFLTILGPFSIVAEADLCQVKSPVVGNTQRDDFGFYGYYVTASYFLTGENRAYDRRLGRLASNYVSKINTPFFRVRDENDCVDSGWGAWELAARYSWVNLDDNVINGGKLSDVTLGVNWYLTYNMKIQFQYINSHRWDVGGAGNSGFTVPQRTGDVQGFGIRTVLEF